MEMKTLIYTRCTVCDKMINVELQTEIHGKGFVKCPLCQCVQVCYNKG